MGTQTSLDAFKENQETKIIDADRKLRVGIIGTGWIAGAHMQSYLKQPDVEIVAAADLIPGKAEKFFASWKKEAEKNGFDFSAVKYYPSHKEMLDDESLKLDAVSVCTYNRQHAEPAIYALNKGVSVLLEKPFTVTLDEAVEVCRAEKNSGAILSIGFQPRMDANMKEIKRIVESGALGKVYYITIGGGRRRGIPTPFGTSFIAKDTGGLGALGDIGCYALDMVLHAIGDPKPLTASGYTSAFFGKDPATYPGHPEYADAFGVDDFACGFVRLEGGVVVDFRTAWAMNLDTMGDTIIMGTKGSLRIPSTECWNGSVGGPMTLYTEVAGLQTETKLPILPQNEDLFYLKIRTFLDAVKNGTPAPVPSSQILYNQAILDGIARSAALGHEISIDIPEI